MTPHRPFRDLSVSRPHLPDSSGDKPHLKLAQFKRLYAL